MTEPVGDEAQADSPHDTTHTPRQPEHDVFVSYSSGDKPVADAIVSRLEQAGVRCWFAPRDVIPGMVWAEAIIDAIQTSRLMVVVLSGAANQSHQVIREVERAVAKAVMVIPFRIESVEPTGAMAYYLAAEHWLDALTPPMESHIAQLVKVSLALLDRPPAVHAARSATQPASAPAPGVRRLLSQPMGLLAIALGAIAVGVVAFFMFIAPGGEPEPSATPTASATPEATATSASSQTPEPATGGPTGVPSSPTELDWNLAANFGLVELSSGFTPDPHSVEVVSGGSIDVSYLGGGCVGYATAAPDYDVRYTAGSSTLLRFYFEADSGDTTMTISAPDGTWYCADDSFESLNPTIDFENPAPGLYDIWIGSMVEGALNAGTLNVTELETSHP